jgi:hypothetical protein
MHRLLREISELLRNQGLYCASPVFSSNTSFGLSQAPSKFNKRVQRIEAYEVGGIVGVRGSDEVLQVRPERQQIPYIHNSKSVTISQDTRR